MFSVLLVCRSSSAICVTSWLRLKSAWSSCCLFTAFDVPELRHRSPRCLYSMDCVPDSTFSQKRAPLLSSELHTAECGSHVADGARSRTPSCPPCANYPYASLPAPHAG